MFGNRSSSSTKPTALGTLLQAATYGMTIPNVYGTTQIAPLPIWAANLRMGKCNSKKGKGAGGLKKKKAPPTYVENIDCLLASNPFDGILQTWDNGTKFPLNFLSQRTSLGASGQITITDPHFYTIVACTMELTYEGLFFDYGGPGPVPYSGTTEFPLWNAANQGPDLIDPYQSRNVPFLYKWVPADGNVVSFYPIKTIQSLDLLGGAWNGFINIYYSQLSAIISRHTPLSKICLTFEPVLGDGPEFMGNFRGTATPLSSQQILYPPYAGVGSPDIDLGTSGAIPLIQLEGRGSFARWPSRGDADFTDMIEDVMKSGMLQTGAQMGLLHRGVNLNELPGAIQKTFQQFIDPASPILNFYQPNAAGNQLIGIVSFRYDPGGGAPGISDTDGNSYATIYGADNHGVFVAKSIGTVTPPNAVTFVDDHGGSNFNADAFIVEMDQGSTVLDNSASKAGLTPSMPTTSDVSASIAVTGDPTYIMAVLFTDVDEITTVPTHWKNLFPQAVGTMPPYKTLVAYRIVNQKGAYTFKTTLPASTNWAIVLLAFKGAQPAPYPKALGNILDGDTLEQTRIQCQANGLYGSLDMNSQKSAADWLKDLYQCADSAPVWSGFRLKSIPRSEVSAYGNGVVFTSPTARGPVARLTVSDLIADSSNPPITVKRAAQVDAYNIDQIQYFDRNSDYAPSVASEPLSGAIALFGPRKNDPTVLAMIQDPLIARKVLTVEVKRYNMLRNSYSFTMHAEWLVLEAMDLILINDPDVNIVNLPVRLTSIKESDTFELECEAEQFVYGANDPSDLPVTTAVPFAGSAGGDPGVVNTPIIFEPVPRLTAQQNQQQLWFVVSGASIDYGGCIVLVSTDGGSTYNPLPGGGTIQGNAVTGYTVGDWPAADDPDTVNDLVVDLTESLGALQSYAQVDEDNFVYPCYVDGGLTCIPYELMTYAVATLLTTPYHYMLVASTSGDHLRRAVFGAPQPLHGVDHPNNSRFAFLNPAGIGILKVAMDPIWIGKTLMFKFLAFNQFGDNLGDQSAATVYSYTPNGCPAQNQNPDNFTYYITGGALTNPTPTTIDMAQARGHFPSNTVNYNARTFTIPSPSVPTRYYVTIADPTYIGDTDAMTNLVATAQTSSALVGVPGNIYIGSIIAMPAGGGTITSQGGLPAGPIPNIVPISGLSAGPNTVAHGLGFSPAAAIIQMNSAAEIWWQATPWDGTNFYLVASDASATCFIIVWGNSP